VFHDCEDEVFAAVVPILVHLFAQIQVSAFRVDHGVVDLAEEGDLWGFAGEVFEGDFELELCVLVEAVADEEDAVPDWVGAGVLSRVSSWGMM
jgi:hypothetical protein